VDIYKTVNFNLKIKGNTTTLQEFTITCQNVQPNSSRNFPEPTNNIPGLFKHLILQLLNSRSWGHPEHLLNHHFICVDPEVCLNRVNFSRKFAHHLHRPLIFPNTQCKISLKQVTCKRFDKHAMRLFAYGPADATAILKPHYLLPHLNPDWFYLSGTGLPDCPGTKAHTHTHPFNVPFSGTTQASRYQKGKTNLDFSEARDSEWQWHQLGHVQVCTLFQTDNHASTSPLCFYWPDALPATQPTASKH